MHIILHGIIFSTVQPADVPAREVQQLAHAAAFLTAVTPPVSLSDVAKDGCWPLIYRQTVGQQCGCCEFWRTGRSLRGWWPRPVGATNAPTVVSTVTATIALCIHIITGPPTGSDFTKWWCSCVRMWTACTSTIR